MIEDIKLVGLCGSRGLHESWRKLVISVVRSLAEAERGIAVGCARGADEMGLRACFTDEGELRVPRLDVFAAFGHDGNGAWKHSAAKLVTRVSQHPMATDDAGPVPCTCPAVTGQVLGHALVLYCSAKYRAVQDKCGEPRIAVSWWAGGALPTPLVPRLKGRSAAMVTAIDMSGDGCGLVAFVGGGPGKSPGTWSTIRLAVKKGVPVVVFLCGCSPKSFPSLGKGRWTTAGKGVWGRGWRWLPAGRAIPQRPGGHHGRAKQPEPELDDEHVGVIEGILSAIFGWKKVYPRRQTVKLNIPFFSNVRTYLYEQNCPNLIRKEEV